MGGFTRLSGPGCPFPLNGTASGCVPFYGDATGVAALDHRVSPLVAAAACARHFRGRVSGLAASRRTKTNQT
ncbi:hypothetical protein [Paenibacillus sp. RC84]|uniref:hypothetical protein n=1 Tax=Paenibacillus sp. RC84 TaxID=3156252 RepID=UPI0035113FE0